MQQAYQQSGKEKELLADLELYYIYDMYKIYMNCIYIVLSIPKILSS